MRGMKAGHAGVSHAKITAEQEQKFVDETTVWDEGKVAEGEVQLQIVDKNLSSFRSRMKDMEKTAWQRKKSEKPKPKAKKKNRNTRK